jgi:hypothetical protein
MDFSIEKFKLRRDIEAFFNVFKEYLKSIINTLFKCNLYCNINI